MGRFQYKLDKRIVNDADSDKPFYLSFKYEGQRDMPPIDIFAWYEHDDVRYHTYDVDHEGNDRPGRYVFKGVPAKYLPGVNEAPRFDAKLLWMFFGKWNQPLFQQEIPTPYFMGTLLDIWYPNWLKPVKMQSISPFTVTMKSCKQWDDAGHVAEQLKIGAVRYAQERCQLK